MNDIMYYSELAEEYYEAACPKFAINGYEKNVLIDTDTERCIFISGDMKNNFFFVANVQGGKLSLI